MASERARGVIWSAGALRVNSTAFGEPKITLLRALLAALALRLRRDVLTAFFEDRQDLRTEPGCCRRLDLRPEFGGDSELRRTEDWRLSLG